MDAEGRAASKLQRQAKRNPPLLVPTGGEPARAQGGPRVYGRIGITPPRPLPIHRHATPGIQIRRCKPPLRRRAKRRLDGGLRRGRESAG